MRLAFVADGHSPIARSWIEHFLQAGHEVHLVSTYPCEPEPRLASLAFVPVAFTGVGGSGERTGPWRAPLGWLRSAAGLNLRVGLRQWLGPLTIRSAGRRLRAELERIQPDLVHALRIPFEGMLAAAADPPAPLVGSTWGNDFTFHARSSPAMTRATKQAMRRLDALHSDCARDLRLAREWGLRPDRPTIVLPGNGGVKAEIFHLPDGSAEPASDEVRRALAGVPEAAPVIVNPRGYRAYVRHDTFFAMAPQVLREHPQARFICPAMGADPGAVERLRRRGLAESILLLPSLSPAAIAGVFRRSQLTVSLGVHDGTPNTLLESMACGCFPVAGDLESIREWISPGVNGLLVDPADPAGVAAAVSRGLAEPELVRSARSINQDLIARRAEYGRCMEQAEAFYRSLVR